MKQLALHGGPKTIEKPFPPYNTIGDEELAAATAVIRSGNLSGFFGSWSKKFYGGPKVRELEDLWSDMFQVKHAVSFNSWTSGLIAAVGALGIEPGDEVIVSPWTMAASATAILVWNAIPVFADIEDKTFNLDPESVERCITPRTRAIMVPDIFGHAADLNNIMDIARRHNLKVIEDAAQSPYTKYHGKFIGTIADIGGFSLNYHKHIHTGEGGIAVTDDDDLAERMRLIRNHAEAVVSSKGVSNLANMIGFNFRLGEIEAAIAIEQLKKLPGLVEMRSRSGALLTKGLKGLKGLRTPIVQDHCSHVYYIYAMVFEYEKTGTLREKLLEALQAEGVPWIYSGYQLIHLLPMYQEKIAYGSNGFPWTTDVYQGNVCYKEGICPVAERLHKKDLVSLQLCQHNYSGKEVELVLKSFYKVWNNLIK